jgi:mannose-6-phosphate isomerase-like protein (cupin superfamily)
MQVVNLKSKFKLFDETWAPKVIGALNGQLVKLARLHGEFIWHKHDEQDELFLILRGTLLMQLRQEELTIREGEMLIVPAGVEHRPVAPEEVHVLLFEPEETVNTGDVRDGRTHDTLEWI